MRYSPYEGEAQAVLSMTDGELLDYFLYRVFETEEVWGLQMRSEWFVHATEHGKLMPLWPYRKYAAEAALDVWQDCTPHASSLEFFLDDILTRMMAADVMLDLMPRGAGAGCLITPHRLKEILVGMQDAGEYRLEG